MLQEYNQQQGGQQKEQQSIYDGFKAVDGGFSERQITPEEKVVLNFDKIHEVGRRITEARADHLNCNFFVPVENKTFIPEAFSRIFNKDFPVRRLEPLTEERLKNDEGEKIGATLFGAVPSNKKILFFNDDAENWFYSQSVTDQKSGVVNAKIWHYELLKNERVLRISSDADEPNIFVLGRELENFTAATAMYEERVMAEMYSSVQKPDNMLHFPQSDDYIESQKAS